MAGVLDGWVGKARMTGAANGGGLQALLSGAGARAPVGAGGDWSTGPTGRIFR